MSYINQKKGSFRRYLVDCTFTQRWRSRFEMQMRSCKRRPCLSWNDVEMSVAVGKNGACMLHCKHDIEEFAYDEITVFFLICQYDRSYSSVILTSRCFTYTNNNRSVLDDHNFLRRDMGFLQVSFFTDPNLTSTVNMCIRLFLIVYESVCTLYDCVLYDSSIIKPKKNI